MKVDVNQINYGLIRKNIFTVALSKNGQMLMIVMYLIHNEGESAVSESFIRNLKGEIYKKVTANIFMFVSIILFSSFYV